MNDGVHALKMLDPMEIPAREIGSNDTRVAVRADIQQSQRVTAIQMLSELRAQVSRGAGNENRFALGHGYSSFATISFLLHEIIMESPIIPLYHSFAHP